MKRLLLGLIVVMLLIVLAIGGLSGWLLGTTSGARWLLSLADRLPAVRVEAEVGGAIWAGLELGGLKVGWPGGELTSEQVRLAWRPARLLRRQLSIEALELGATRVRWQKGTDGDGAGPPGAPFVLSDLWPTLPEWLPSVVVDLQRFTLAELSLGGVGGSPMVFEGLRGEFVFRNGGLEARQLSIGLPCGRWQGDLQLDLAERRLAADLLWAGEPFLADWDRVRTRVELDETLQGPLRAAALAGEDERVQLQAQASLALSGVALDDVVASRSEGPDQISGVVDIAWADGFRLEGDLVLNHLDLAAEAGWPTALSGALQARLDTRGYAGTVDLVNARPGLEQVELAARVDGDWRGLRLSEARAAWLDGRLTGVLDLAWNDGFRLAGALRGSGLDPSRLNPALQGELQLQVAGDLQIPRQGDLVASWDADLGESRLRGRPFSGRIAGRWQNRDLVIDALDLGGDGLRVSGAGRLSQRIDLQLQVADLGRLGERWSGALEAAGWLARPGEDWQGAALGSLDELGLGELVADGGTFRIDYPGPADEGRLEARLNGLLLPGAEIEALALEGAGRLEQHHLDLRLAWPTGQASGRLEGGWSGEAWRGELTALQGADPTVGSWQLASPAALHLAPERIVVDGLRLGGDQGGELGLSADLAPSPLSGRGEADWRELPLELIDPWLAAISLAGTTSGELDFEVAPGQPLELTARIEATPTIGYGGGTLAFAPGRAALRWDGDGLAASGELSLARGGSAAFSLAAPGTEALRPPEHGELTLDWNQLALRQFAFWLPPGLVLEGDWNGRFTGSWGRELPIVLDGRSWIETGKILWQSDDGLVELPLRRAELSGGLRDGWAAGDLALELGQEGRIAGRFRLPTLLAEAGGRLDAEASFALQELGLLRLVMPGVVNETRGDLSGKVRLAGTWAEPQLFGSLSLRDAGADVPQLGLRLRGAELDASFDRSRIAIERFQVVSGEGRLTGTGEVLLQGWRPESWSVALGGENVRLVHLPEITLEASPDLEVTGAPERLSVHGKLKVPTLLISEVPRNRMVEPSEDVVFADAPAEQSAGPRFKIIDVRVEVELGEHVAVKARGLDARLAGELVVSTNAQGTFIGQGEIRVEQGHYAAYGLKLPITRGRAAFGGGALQNPTLDVLAERTVGEVKAGVRISGTPRRPVVKLVSDPSLPETEILSYIVLGRPLNATSGEQDNLMLAAGALLSQGESAALQEKLKRQFGLDTLEVQSGGEAGVEGSMVAVGKYLTPELYLSFGQSLFTRENVTRLRYQLTDRWELESQFGTVSGADLSYRLEFR